MHISAQSYIRLIVFLEFTFTLQLGPNFVLKVRSTDGKVWYVSFSVFIHIQQQMTLELKDYIKTIKTSHTNQGMSALL